MLSTKYSTHLVIFLYSLLKCSSYGIYLAVFGEPSVISLIVQSHTASQLLHSAHFKWTIWRTLLSAEAKDMLRHTTVLLYSMGVVFRGQNGVSLGGLAIVSELSGCMIRVLIWGRPAPFTCCSIFHSQTTSNINWTWLRKERNQIQYLPRRSTSKKTNEVWETRINWSSETLTNCNAYNLQGALSNSGTPESFRFSLLICGPVSWFSPTQTGCCQIFTALMWKHSAEEPVSSVFLAPDEWKIPPLKRTHTHSRWWLITTGIIPQEDIFHKDYRHDLSVPWAKCKIFGQILWIGVRWGTVRG